MKAAKPSRQDSSLCSAARSITVTPSRLASSRADFVRLRGRCQTGSGPAFTHEPGLRFLQRPSKPKFQGGDTSRECSQRRDGALPRPIPTRGRACAMLPALRLTRPKRADRRLFRLRRWPAHRGAGLSHISRPQSGCLATICSCAISYTEIPGEHELNKKGIKIDLWASGINTVTAL